MKKPSQSKMTGASHLGLSLFIHDLKTPVAVIELGVRSLTDRQEKYGPLTPFQRRALDQVLREIDALHLGIDTALNAGRAGAGRWGGLLKRLSRRGDESVDGTQRLLLDIERRLLRIDEGILLFARSDVESDPPTEPQSRVLERLKRSIRRSLILIGNAKILVFSRELENNPQRIRLVEAVRRPLVEIFDLRNVRIADRIEKLPTAAGLKELVAEEGVVLQVEGWLLDRQCLLDREKFGRILVNLLLNAFRFRNETIWLTLNHRDQRLLLGVADDGEGVSEQVRQAILNGRSAGGPVSGSLRKNHGIGLAGTRLLVQEMGGDLEIESAAGEGARFTVTLPCRMFD